MPARTSDQAADRDATFGCVHSGVVVSDAATDLFPEVPDENALDRGVHQRVGAAMQSGAIEQDVQRVAPVDQDRGTKDSRVAIAEWEEDLQFLLDGRQIG